MAQFSRREISGRVGRDSGFGVRLVSLSTWLFVALLVHAVAPGVTALPVVFPRDTPADGVPKEINPVTPKFKTLNDKDMPGYPDFSVGLGVKDNLASWDDEHLVLRTRRFLPGMFQTRLGLGNGLVFFLLLFHNASSSSSPQVSSLYDRDKMS